MPVRDRERGSALVIVMLLMALLMTLVVGYFMLTYIETSATGASLNGARGFYGAEAGLNIRAGDIRDTFLGFNRPSGTSPDNGSGRPCDGGDMGSGDYQCETHALDARVITTYIEEAAGNPSLVLVPRGERFQNLNAQEYGYQIASSATNPFGHVEAVLEIEFKSRLIPLFQFAAFYNKDLEILPGPAMALTGPVHTNGDLYLTAGITLDIDGQVSSAGEIFRGRKEADACSAGDVSVADPGTMTPLPGCSGLRVQLTEAQLTPWNGMVRRQVDPLTVPPPEALDPDPGQLYWDRADLRIMLDLDSGPPVIEVRNSSNSADVARTVDLASCAVAAYTNTFYNHREAANIEMMDVDVVALLDCAHNQLLLEDSRALDDDTEGGLVIYLGVEGTDMNGINNYGVRVYNGAELESTAVGAPAILGLTVVTNQAIYVEGNYNAIDKKPAAFIADSLNVLSNAWNDANSALVLSSRIASSTTINAGFLAGTDTSGGTEGSGGQDLGQYNGGLENYPRFHEDWTGRTLTYRGSFVSLYAPRHVDGLWSAQSYSAPIRDWDYDTDFNDAVNLPPISPRFVYLKQELFVRQFEF